MSKIDPQLVGPIALLAAIFTIGFLLLAIRPVKRPKVPDYIWEEIADARTVRLRCRHCGQTTQIVQPVACEGAMIVRDIFAGQHRLCAPQPVTFV